MIKGGPSTVTMSEAEMIFYTFKAYKSIKAPSEWTQHVLHLETKAGEQTSFKLENIMDSTQKKFSDLKAQNNWKPSDKSPDEHLVSLLDQFKWDSGVNSRNANSQDNSDQKGKRNPPPFAKHSGTEGQTKKYKGKTYYY